MGQTFLEMAREREIRAEERARAVEIPRPLLSLIEAEGFGVSVLPLVEAAQRYVAEAEGEKP